MEKMDKIEFYAECDRLFEQEHPVPVQIKYRRTGRWGPRTPGSGRFEGFGLVRWFNPNTVHMSLRYPVGLHKITTPAHALEIIESLLKAAPLP